MKLTPILASVLGAVSVAMGAIGSHVARNGDGADYQNWMIAVQFALFHVLAAILASVKPNQNAWARFAGVGFIFGTVCFSGSIWIKAAWPPETFAFSGIIGPAAPIGGVSLMLSWVLLAVSFLRPRLKS